MTSGGGGVHGGYIDPRTDMFQRQRTAIPFRSTWSMLPDFGHCIFFVEVSIFLVWYLSLDFLLLIGALDYAFHRNGGHLLIKRLFVIDLLFKYNNKKNHTNIANAIMKIYEHNYKNSKIKCLFSMNKIYNRSDFLTFVQ